MAPHKILYLITKANWGGAQRYVFDLATAMRDGGMDVAVAYGAPGGLAEKLEEAGIRGIALESLERDVSLRREWRAFRALQQTLRDERPDVLHVNSSKAGGLGALAGRLAGVPRIVFTAHGWAWNEDRPWWQKILIRGAAYATVLLSHTTVCVSEAVRHDARWMPLARRKFTLVRNGMRAPSFATRAEARAHLLPDAACKTWVGMLSELHPTKRVDDAINAFARIAARHPDAALVVLGEGAERAYLEAYAESCGVAGRVFLRGFVPDGARYLPAFDIFLHSSRSEALAYAVIEAGFAGLPVVATRVGGLPEIVESRKSGILVPAERPELLAAALSECLDDPARAAAFGAALQERVETRFSVERMIAETRRVYGAA